MEMGENEDSIDPPISYAVQQNIFRCIAQSHLDWLHIINILFESLDSCSCPETILAILQRYPSLKHELNLDFRINPLTLLIEIPWPDQQKDAGKMASLLIQAGASADIRDPATGMTLLHLASMRQNVAIVEALLRAGCRINVFDNHGDSPLSLVLFRNWEPYYHQKLLGLHTVELLLAFGVDLQQELYLYDDHELPPKYAGPETANRRDPGKIDQKWLGAMRELRRCKTLISVQRLCRNVIRRYLKSNADEVIAQLDYIPTALKIFLLVENEQALVDFLK